MATEQTTAVDRYRRPRGQHPRRRRDIEEKTAEQLPEYLARFDSYPGGPSNLDLGIIGHVGCSAPRPSLFVGVEAKVDETFGSTVDSRYRSAVKDRRDGKRTNAPERVKELLSKYFSVSGSPETSWFSGTRYQLLTEAAGTVAAPGDVFVFYIGRSLVRKDSGSRADELELDGKRLVCIYDYAGPLMRTAAPVRPCNTIPV